MTPTDPLSQPVAQYRRLWGLGPPPSLAQFLTTIPRPAASQLVALAITDQRLRWRRGDRVPTEHYLEEWPQVREHPAGWLLPLNELVVAQEYGEAAVLDVYFRRFPAWAEALREVIPRLPRPARDAEADRNASIAFNAAAGWAAAAREVLACLHEPGATLPPTRPVPLQPPAATPVDLPGVIPGFQILGPIRSGGMGTIWRARDLTLGREVAIKTLKAELGPAARAEAEQLFVREAHLGGRLEHPAIVPIHALGYLADGAPFYVMKLIRGAALDGRLPRPPAQGAERLALIGIFHRVAEALAYAHEQGVIHRDLKPHNVMVGAFGEVQVIDWGLAKDLRAGADEPGAWPQGAGDLGAVGNSRVAGTPAYMPPEQTAAQGQAIDARADVFALGAILCQILTGAPPYRGETIQSVYEQARTGDLADAFGRLDGCGADAELVALARACLAADRERRPRDAGAVAARVAAYLAGVEERLRAAENQRVAAEARAAADRRARRRLIGLVAVLFVSALGAGVLAGLADHQRQAAEYARASAEAAHDRTRQTLEAVVTEEQLERWKRQPQLTQEQQDLLRRMAAFYREAVAVAPATRPERERQAETFYRMGHVHYALEQGREAEAAVRQGLALWDGLAAEFPGEAPLRERQAHGHNLLAILLVSRGAHAEAEQAFRQALDGPLPAGQPLTPRQQRERAHGWNNRGNLLLFLGKHGEAEKAYHQALALNQELTRGFPNEPAHRRDWAESSTNLGILLADLGKGADAEAAYREALGLWDDLRARISGGGPDYLAGRARTLDNLGNLLAARGDHSLAEAGQCYRQALDIRGPLAAEYPGVPAYRQDLVRGHNNLGSLLSRKGDHRAAEREQRQALDLARKLAADFPATPDYRRDLAVCHANLGETLLKLGHHDAAAEAVRQALALLERLEAELPGRAVELGISRAIAATHLGDVLRDQGRSGESLPWYGQAIAAAEAIRARDDRLVEAQDALRNGHGNRALALDRLGRHAEALADWQAAVQLSPARRQPGIWMQRAGSWAATGKAAEGVAEAERLVRQNQASGSLRYAAAGVLARATAATAGPPQREQYAARAVELLREAQARGVFQHQAILAAFHKDPDFDPLRQRPDFQKFLAEVTGEPPAGDGPPG